MAKRRKNGEGTWGKKKINGIEYSYYRDANGKYFYGKTQKEILQKRQDYEKTKFVFGTNTTVNKYLTWWLDNIMKPSIASKTYDGYEDAIIRIRKFSISDYELQSLNQDIIQKFMLQLAEKYSYATIRKTFNVLNGALKYAVSNKDLSEMPYSTIKLPSESNVAVKKKEAAFLQPDEMKKLYEESKRVNTKEFNYGGKIGDKVYGINAELLVFIEFTGLRLSEARGLKWKNQEINITNANVLVKNRDEKLGKKIKDEYKDTKTSKSKRTIPLCDISLEMLNNASKRNPQHNDDDYVFLTQLGTSPNPRNVARTLDTMLERAGCSRCNIHGLRHSFGSLLIINGANIKYVSEVMGHSKVSTTYDIYINLTKEEIGSKIRNFLNV